MSERWIELGDGVLVRRHRSLDQSIGLVVGDDGCLVVDTRGDLVAGAELAAAVREVTRLPWTVVLTHSHWDHCFGTAEFQPTTIWAHELCHADLMRSGIEQRDNVARHYAASGQPEVAERLLAVEPVLPDRLMRDRAELSVGGRRVVLSYFGPGHTDNDIVVQVPDAGVVFAGDLVEQGAPPSFSDSHPLAWPTAVQGIIGLAPRVVSPGHGEPVDLDFVIRQQAELTLIADLCSDLVTDRCSMAAALDRSPYPAAVLHAAVSRVRTSRPDVPK
ncbi:MAG TPA: MBL fold metallo-hydrolase [Pseudonocardiaceae bacterium]|jgi:glyoxylase-like metal-dependent hydrolase (beta-lactamase superfamily II)|nr:MBL fold metallo-hydrolase [Pseudonocardiaceae bacterium]